MTTMWDESYPPAVLFPEPSVPTPTGVGPDSGPAGGGTDVTLFGSGFTGTTVVRFGGVAATNLVVTSSTRATARTPAHAAGLVDVTMTNPAGTGTGTGIFTYTAAEEPEEPSQSTETKGTSKRARDDS